jgi:metal-sulfur cluster biosynthetic enzyme
MSDASTGQSTRPSVDEIREAIRPVEDPEIGIGVVDLGLIYRIENKGGSVEIDMTLTTPFCPLGPEMMSSVDRAVRALPGVRNVTVNLVFTPQWNPKTMASEEARDALNIW